MTKTVSRSLILILVFAFVIRAALASRQPTGHAAIDRLPDQREYLTLSQNLLHEGSLYFFDARFKQDVFAYRMPGYPLFLAACGGSIAVARMAQCAIDVSTLLAVFLISRRLTESDLTALAAAGLLAVNPFYIFFSSLILSETLFTALIAWAILSLISRRRILAMILLACSCYVRTTGLLFLPLILLTPPVNTAESTAYRLRDATRGFVIATLFTFACLFPWAWRNHEILGDWLWTTTNTGVTLYDGFHPGATGASDQRFITNLPILKSINEGDRSRYFSEQAREWIGNHLQEIPLLSARKVMRGWSPVPLSADFGRPVYRWISAAYSVPFDLLCLIGLFSRRINDRAKLLLIFPAIVVTVGQVMSVGSIRYRIPAEAPLAVLAAVGTVELLSKQDRMAK